MPKFKRIENLSNSEYHHSPEYSGYVSSTQLKQYLKSPKHFKHCIDARIVSEETDAMQLGSLFHSLMESIDFNRQESGLYDKWEAEEIAVFHAPVNEKTGKPYGVSSNVYQSALEVFVGDNEGKILTTSEDVQLVKDMADAMFYKSGSTSRKLRTFFKSAKSREVSYFYEDEESGVKLKIRPDMLTNSRVIDWKTTALSDLSEDSIAKAILNYGYHISLSMYQYVLHEIAGKWYTPLLVFVQKQAPHDCVICDISEWCYEYNEDLDDVALGVGAMEFTRLLNMHKECLSKGVWNGAESLIPKENKSIMKPRVPAWYSTKIMTDE